MTRFYAWWIRNWTWTQPTTKEPEIKNTIHNLLTRAKTFLGSVQGRTYEHLGLVFASTFAIDAAGNAKHVFEAHGLDGLKAAGYGIAATALAAAYHVVKPQLKALLAKLVPSAKKAP